MYKRRTLLSRVKIIIWCSTENLTKYLFCSAVTTNIYLRGKRLLVNLPLPSPRNVTFIRAVSSDNSRIVIGTDRSAESFNKRKSCVVLDLLS